MPAPETAEVPFPKEVSVEPTNELVYIVDDEANVGEALSTLLRANGKRVRIFTSGQAFIDFPAKTLVPV
jgi:FixJ family two-component response regulator